MAGIPLHIEQYLLDTGFCATEILVLRKMLEHDHATIRELAVQTGKSTGVLDQAMKKLISKCIVQKECINGSPRYALHSIDSVSQWVQCDLKRKTDRETRRLRDFELFLSTLTMQKHRPQMEYYEGENGLQRAYMRLLEYGDEICRYLPFTNLPIDSPMEDFHAFYAKARLRRRVFERVIAQDNCHGRRFQSSDHLNYRQTILVCPDRFPFLFEKVLVGDAIMVFHHEHQRACLIEFSQYARSEQELYEAIWRHEGGVGEESGSRRQGPGKKSVKRVA